MSNEDNVNGDGTEVAEAPKAKPRRVAALVIGFWEDGSFKALPKECQPSGQAARKVDALRRWLNQAETAAKLSSFVETVEVIRKELVNATYTATTVVKAKVS